ncbi:hypothetical protein QA601_00980 [Chitinispirillales bacterium ANBcel5]|uniref:tetratricopeptide repeat protein n=1 Tax=Cellulosispirillum alkaliphilum TaxID=3039283 RepID=UPI002A516D6C|nr:hypothetical protein [Chitinispirillales bacterium ANBcel5]
MALEKYSKAAVNLEKALEIDSTMSDAYLMLHEIARSVGDRKEALEWLKKYPKDGARRYDVLLITGELLLEMGDSAGALASFRQSTRTAPERMRGWMELVQQLKRMGTPYTALIEAQAALDSNSEFIPLALMAARIAFEAAFYDRAEKFYQVAFKAGHPDGVVGLSNLLTLYGRYNDSDGVQRVQSIINNYN